MGSNSVCCKRVHNRRLWYILLGMGQFDDGLRRGKGACMHAHSRAGARMVFCNLLLVREVRNPLAV